MLALAWYLFFAKQEILWQGSAGWTANAAGLGVGKAPGFPLQMALGKVATFLPVGEFSFRMSVLSSVCAAIAVAGVVRLILETGKEDLLTCIAAAAGGGILAAALLTTAHAVSPGVVSLAAAFLIWTTILFLRVAKGGGPSMGLALAWMLGVGLGLHGLLHITLLLPVVGVFLIRLYRGAKWPLLTPALTLFSGLALQLYLPIRSAKGPLLLAGWGQPDTLSRYWNYVNPAAQSAALPQEVSTAHLLAGPIGYLCLLAGGVGVLTMLTDKKMRWLGGLFVFGLAINLGVIGESSSVNQMQMLEVFLWLILCVGTGVAIAQHARNLGMAGVYIAGFFSVAVLVSPVLVAMSTQARPSVLPRELSESVIAVLPPTAVVLPQSETIASALPLLQLTEGVRPDVAVINVVKLADSKYVRRVLRSFGPGELLWGDKRNTLAQVVSTGRPLFWENGIFAPPGKGLRPGALVSELVSAKRSRGDPMTAAAKLAHLYSIEEKHGSQSRRFLADAFTHLAALAASGDDWPTARQLYQRALWAAPGHRRATMALEKHRVSQPSP